MSASDPPSPALVRAHQSSDQIGWDAWQAQNRIAHAAWEAAEKERRSKLTLMDPAERARLNALGCNLDEYGEVMEPEGCLAGGFVRVNPKVVAEEKAEKEAAAAAQKKKHRTYSDGSYRISKRSPEAARTELIVSNALRYAEELQKKEGRIQQAPTMPPSRRGRRVHFRC